MGGYAACALGLILGRGGKVARIGDETLKRIWPIRGQLAEQYFLFNQQMNRENPGRAAVNKAYADLSELRLRLLDLRLQTREDLPEDSDIETAARAWARRLASRVTLMVTGRGWRIGAGGVIRPPPALSLRG